MINGITDKTGAKISIEDDGSTTIYCRSKAGAEEAAQIIQGPHRGARDRPRLPGHGPPPHGLRRLRRVHAGPRGLVHISKLARERVEKVSDVLHEGPGDPGQARGDRPHGPAEPQLHRRRSRPIPEARARRASHGSAASRMTGARSVRGRSRRRSRPRAEVRFEAAGGDRVDSLESSCRAAHGSSWTSSRGPRPWRWGSGVSPGRATRSPTARAIRTFSSTWCSRAPRAARPSTSPARSTGSAG